MRSRALNQKTMRLNTSLQPMRAQMQAPKRMKSCYNNLLNWRSLISTNRVSSDNICDPLHISTNPRSINYWIGYKKQPFATFNVVTKIILKSNIKAEKHLGHLQFLRSIYSYINRFSNMNSQLKRCLTDYDQQASTAPHLGINASIITDLRLAIHHR